MIIIFNKFKTFWTTFWDSIRQAYNKAFKHPVATAVQEWRDVVKINLLDIFVNKLNNLCNIEAAFEVQSDSVQAEPLKILAKKLEDKRFDITAAMLADGDYYVFPATNDKGDIIHTYLTQQQVRITDSDGDAIKEAYGLIDWYIDQNNKVYYLLRHHKLINDDLEISYNVVNERGANTELEKWNYLKDQEYRFVNAKHIGFGRYKSPISSRGLSPVYGVPLNFGCGEIEEKIFNDLRLIEDEFKNSKSVIFTDTRNIKPKNSTVENGDAGENAVRVYGAAKDVMENIIPIKHAPNHTGSQVEIFNPNIRYSSYYSKLVSDLALYEKQIGTSKGILTDNETSETATATAVKRANADTIALLDNIQAAIDCGNEMTLDADAVYLNISKDLWSYVSDWYDPFEDPAEQWKRLVEAKGQGAAETADLVKWLFPSLSDDEVNEKLARIAESSQSDMNNALERMIGGA